MPNSTEYKVALERAIADLEAALDKRDELDEEREQVETHVDNLRYAIFGLATLAGEDRLAFQEGHPDLFPEFINPDTGLTDAVRQVLETGKPNWFTAVGMRDALIERKYEFTAKNVLATLHTVLKRLVDNDEVYAVTRGGKTQYRFKPKTLRKSK